MTIHVSKDVENAIEAAVRSGLFGSADEMVDTLVRAYARRHPGRFPADAETEDQEVQRRLFAAGLLSEIKPPIRDFSPYRDRKPVPIQGEPLSETVIRERR